jgi:hypothetical protein
MCRSRHGMELEPIADRYWRSQAAQRQSLGMKFTMRQPPRATHTEVCACGGTDAVPFCSVTEIPDGKQGINPVFTYPRMMSKTERTLTVKAAMLLTAANTAAVAQEISH